MSIIKISKIVSRWQNAFVAAPVVFGKILSGAPISQRCEATEHSPSRRVWQQGLRNCTWCALLKILFVAYFHRESFYRFQYISAWYRAAVRTIFTLSDFNCLPNQSTTISSHPRFSITLMSPSPFSVYKIILISSSVHFTVGVPKFLATFWSLQNLASASSTGQRI